MHLTIRTTLRHLALVTWAVPVERLQALLPAGLVPQSVPSPDGPRGLFSVAVMLEAGLAPAGVPWLGLTFPQLNERTYVARPDGAAPGVFFWRSLVGSAAGLVPRLALGLPYFQRPLDLAVDGPRLRFHVDGDLAVDLDLTTPPATTASPPGGIDLARVRAITANPMVGYSLVRERHLASFEVEHAAIELRDVTVRHAATAALVARPTLEPDQRPVHAGYVAEAPFVIRLPPRRVS